MSYSQSAQTTHAIPPLLNHIKSFKLCVFFLHSRRCILYAKQNRALLGNWSAEWSSLWAHLHFQDMGATGQKMGTKNDEIAAALFALCNLQCGRSNSQSLKVNSEGINLMFGSSFQAPGDLLWEVSIATTSPDAQTLRTPLSQT